MKQFYIIVCLAFSIMWTQQVYALQVCGNQAYRSYSALNDNKSISNTMIAMANTSWGYATLISTGTTTEGREIKGLLITSPTGIASKATVLITGAIHADEWIGSEVAIGLAEYLIANGTNTDSVFGPKNMNIKKLLENVKVVIVPVLNPDGYEYSMTNYQETCLSSNPPPSCYDNGNQNGNLYSEWRKNRRDLSPISPGAIGVDINRNFAKFWSGSELPGSSTYGGLSSLSEAETQAVTNLFGIYRFSAVIDFHSGAQYILYPWAGSATEIDDANQFLRPYSSTRDNVLFRKIGEKIAGYIGLNSQQVMRYYYVDNPPSGTARDWEYDAYHSAAFNIELALKHQPPTSQISSICGNNINGPLWLMFWAADQGFRSKPKLYFGQ